MEGGAGGGAVAGVLRRKRQVVEPRRGGAGGERAAAIVGIILCARCSVGVGGERRKGAGGPAGEVVGELAAQHDAEAVALFGDPILSRAAVAAGNINFIDNLFSIVAVSACTLFVAALTAHHGRQRTADRGKAAAGVCGGRGAVERLAALRRAAPEAVAAEGLRQRDALIVSSLDASALAAVREEAAARLRQRGAHRGHEACDGAANDNFGAEADNRVLARHRLEELGELLLLLFLDLQRAVVAAAVRTAAAALADAAAVVGVGRRHGVLTSLALAKRRRCGAGISRRRHARAPRLLLFLDAFHSAKGPRRVALRPHRRELREVPLFVQVDEFVPVQRRGEHDR